ncbi:MULTISPECIES: hypothetical protein [Butyricimonas]|jgi:hypothetical protein|uniref:Golvesin/Xly CBD-like domain-containing protein n=3 Tax=Butyricimonas virosa TaxID=544645 RepID=A0A415QG75_9BACT|nr:MULTISPECIES: hypothetical protein [Butyricimonas]MCI7164834.1 hypothetical protein [Butyricimonas virosa]MDY5011566.1 hypothetical protein [Butyricimonas virosa]RGV32844.1 hypothetical protein DWW18_12890 [Butyricimonas virosa]RHM41892.1 hypothetical protein DWZ68_12295 [Butyricimonas virosa]HAM85652.1 hypothetical protein [Butyricimonas sp.]
MALDKIRLIASYERKIIRRHLSFWIFLICIVFGIAGVQWYLQVDSPVWAESALSATVPYMNAWFFNLLQSLLVIFVGVEFVWRDRRLGTNETFLSRSETNVEYMFGKIWGVMKLCLLLNLVSIGIAIMIHLLFMETVAFKPLLYLFYLFTLTFPALVFVFGISLFAAMLIRNYYLALLLLMIGFIGSYFATPWVLYGTFDPWARSLPLLFSDAIGFANIGILLLHRLAYFFCGIGLIFLSVLLVKRMDDRRSAFRKVLGILASGFILLGIFAGALYLNTYLDINQRRVRFRIAQEKYMKSDRVQVVSNRMVYKQSGDRLHVESFLLLVNKSKQSIDTPILYLNPGLSIVSLTSEEQELFYNREGHVVVIKRRMECGEELPLRVEYEGIIDEAICYLELPDEEYHDTRMGILPLSADPLGNMPKTRHELYSNGGRFAHVGNKYTILLPECLWYLSAVPPVNLQIPSMKDFDFTDYRLEVEGQESKTVISQGSMKKNEKGISYSNDHPLPRLSLCIGDYEQKTITVDSLSFGVYYFPGHDFWTEGYNLSPDSSRLLMSYHLGVLERQTGNSLPVNRLSIVEMPLNFRPYLRQGQLGSNFVQPELVFFPEKLFTESYRSIKDILKLLKTKRSLDSEVEGVALRSNVLNRFFEPIYNIMPMYQEFRTTIYSDKFPCIGDLIYEIRFSGQSKDHLSLNEKVKTIQYWDGRSLRGALMDRDNPVEYIMLKKKREHINSLIATRVEMMYMWDFIEDFVKCHPFQRVDFDVFAREFKDQFNVNIDSLLERYYADDRLPTLFVQDLKMESYNGIPLGSCKVYNPSNIDGVLRVDGYDQKLRRQRPNYFLIPAKSCKEIRVRNYTIPNFAVELGLCCNLPDKISIIFNDREETEKDWEGIRDVDSSTFRLPLNEIIVDNEDVGFRLVKKDKRKKWGERFLKEQEYQGMENVGDEWILSISSSSYGYKIKSAYCKKAGMGEEYAEWMVKIKEPGKYRVAVHVPEYLYAIYLGSFLKNARLYYQVFSEEGDTYVELDLNEEAPGWIELGTYEFSEGNYFVRLSDKGGTDLQPVIKTGMLKVKGNSNITCSQMIIADAVKWVKVE